MELVHASISEFIAYGGEPPELKHLSRARREIKRDFVEKGANAKEAKPREENSFGVTDLRYVSEDLAEWYGGKPTRECDSHVCEKESELAGSKKRDTRNPWEVGGPPSKPKILPTQ